MRGGSGFQGLFSDTPMRLGEDAAGATATYEPRHNMFPACPGARHEQDMIFTDQNLNDTQRITIIITTYVYLS